MQWEKRRAQEISVSCQKFQSAARGAACRVSRLNRLAEQSEVNQHRVAALARS